VQIDRLEWSQIDAQTLQIRVDCGKGTYIRALARDIGAALGCGAHLDQLVRTAVGPFRLADAVSLEALMADPSLLGVRLLQPEVAIIDWPAVTLAAPDVQRIVNGLPVRLPDLSGDQARAHQADGALLALLRNVGEEWRPTKVFLT
jgi:tRNA pseudouridine55 synthase